MSPNLPSGSLGLPPLCRLTDLVPALRISRSTIWSLTAKGEFPRPLKLTRGCTAWRRADVEAWIDRRQADSPLMPVAVKESL
jgi:prophage regulatory protein